MGWKKVRTMNIHHPTCPGRNGPKDSVNWGLKTAFAGKVGKILGFNLNQITKKGLPGFTYLSKVVSMKARTRRVASMIQRIDIKSTIIATNVKIAKKEKGLSSKDQPWQQQSAGLFG